MRRRKIDNYLDMAGARGFMVLSFGFLICNLLGTYYFSLYGTTRGHSNDLARLT